MFHCAVNKENKKQNVLINGAINLEILDIIYLMNS